MSESKIKPFIRLILRRLKILLPLFVVHGIPDLCALAVAPLVVFFCEHVQSNVHNRDSDEVLVAVTVPRSVTCLVDVGTNDPACLHGHVV